MQTVCQNLSTFEYGNQPLITRPSHPVSIKVTKATRHVIQHQLFLQSNTTVDTSGSGSDYPSVAHTFNTFIVGFAVVRSDYHSGIFKLFFQWGSYCQSLVVCVMFCRPLFACLSLSFWHLYCLFIDLQLMAASMISLYFSYSCNCQSKKLHPGTVNIETDKQNED